MPLATTASLPWFCLQLKWTAQALYRGGLAVDPNGVVFSGQVIDQVRRLAEQQAEAGIGSVTRRVE